MDNIKPDDIKKILIIGSGTLGLRIGLQAAISGFEVCMYDLTTETLDNARSIQRKILNSLAKSNTTLAAQSEVVLDRISFTSDARDAATGIDLVSESVTEDVVVKKAVWKQFGKLCPAHCLFTTNTSFLLPSLFAADSGRPDRFCAFHFHDVFVANVVDIMPHPGTSPWVIDLLFDIGKKLNQTPIKIQKESNGYIFNYMLMHILTSAGALFASNVGSIQDIDRSWMGNFKMPVGPFGMLDQIGLDTAWHVSMNSDTPKSREFADLLKQYMDLGKLGVKTGEGFYKYPNPEYQQEGFVS